MHNPVKYMNQLVTVALKNTVLHKLYNFSYTTVKGSYVHSVV